MSDDIATDVTKEPETAEELDAAIAAREEELAMLASEAERVTKEIEDATAEDRKIIEDADKKIDELVETATEEDRQGGMGAAREEIDQA